MGINMENTWSIKENSLIEIKKPAFHPLSWQAGNLPIEDHGLISDGKTAALIGRDGALVWLCVPQFDAPVLFGRLLDQRKGGVMAITPEKLTESRQYYLPDSGVLVTEMRTPTGVVRVTDLLTLRAGADLTEGSDAARGELLRHVRVEGEVRLHVVVDPRGGAEATVRGDGWRVRCTSFPDVDLQLHASRPLDGLRTMETLRAGESFHLKLSWKESPYLFHAKSPEEQIEDALKVWRGWLKNFSYDGPRLELVRRSAITLKMLDFFENGAIVAAPTSSLPETIGGRRNWDYRYTWIRDAAFSVYALRRIGLDSEAWAFLSWVLGKVEGVGEHPCVLYKLDGTPPLPEWEDPELEGYRGSFPVRWGNAAAHQKQHDVFGELIDCAYQWVVRGGRISDSFWRQLRGYIEAARREWSRPDSGIWEIRTSSRIFTYSAALCQVALDRGAKIAEMIGKVGDIAGWRMDAHKIRSAILEQAWDKTRQSLTEHLGGGGLDASLLTLPIRRVIPADHPRMIATTQAVTKNLGAGKGLLYRYLPDESPDGLSEHEGAFLLCSFWLVDNLAHQGRLGEALELYDSLCSRANPLGLLPEQIDPASGAFLGNYPQAFSQVGVIASGITLTKLMKKQKN